MLNLPRASEPETNPGVMQMARYIGKSASMGDFAARLFGVTGRPAVDRGGDSGIALRVKESGLQLQAEKERRSVMAVDHLNATPTPN